MMRIVCERTGGFAGLTLRAEVDSEQLTPAEARKLKRLVKESQVLDQPAKAEGAMPDQYQYDLEIEDEGRTRTIQTNDAAASEEMAKLIEWVIETARRARK
jgi:hypothetical protein